VGGLELRDARIILAKVLGIGPISSPSAGKTFESTLQAPTAAKSSICRVSSMWMLCRQGWKILNDADVTLRDFPHDPRDEIASTMDEPVQFAVKSLD
jgi:hypothetical protein